MVLSTLKGTLILTKYFLLLGGITIKKQTKFLERLYDEPFKTIDTIKLHIGRYDFNLLKEDAKLRKVILHVTIALYVLWFMLGFDSGTGMIEWPIIYVFGNLFMVGKTYGPMTFDGVITFEGASYWFNWAYGKFMHFSAFVIYGFAFYFLSNYLAKSMNIRGSENTYYSFASMFFSISIFEFFWMISYYVFQNQPWILKFQWPQLRILLQNTGLFFIGIVFFVYIVLPPTRVKIRLNWRSWVFIGLTVASILLWWYYPFNVQPLEVNTTTGLWMNTPNFPQTTYTIDIDPLDEVNAGIQYYLEDNLVHGVNTLVKILMAGTFMYICMLVPREEKPG